MSYERTNLVIKNVVDFGFKIDYVFEKWQTRNFDKGYLDWLQDKWVFSPNVYNLMVLVKAKASLTPELYEAKETKTFEEFKLWTQATMNFFTMSRVQRDALLAAGTSAKEADYHCPLCGGEATVFKSKKGFDWKCEGCVSAISVQEVA